MTWATDRLEAVRTGQAAPPAVVETLKLGTLDEWGPGWARKRWHGSPEVLNADGSMFGGYIAALADQMLAFAAMTVVPDDAMFRTVQLQVQYFRVTRGEELTIEARVIAQSKATISVEAEFHNAGGIVAKASAVQVLRPLRP